MAFNFNPLWKLLIDKNMAKVQLGKEIGVSSSTLAKMSKNEYVAMEVLDRICSLLECGIGDVIEHKKDAGD
jgi:DNA-binding Xre family transcriptional regulator